MTDLNEAFSIPIRMTKPKPGSIIGYEHKCPTCNSRNTFALLNDMGSIQMCMDCKEAFPAKPIFEK